MLHFDKMSNLTSFPGLEWFLALSLFAPPPTCQFWNAIMVTVNAQISSQSFNNSKQNELHHFYWNNLQKNLETTIKIVILKFYDFSHYADSGRFSCKIHYSRRKWKQSPIKQQIWLASKFMAVCEEPWVRFLVWESRKWLLTQ